MSTKWVHKTVVAVFCICCLASEAAPPVPKEPNDAASRGAKEAFKEAEIDVELKDWDSAMENILTALGQKKEKKYIELLGEIATQYYAAHEAIARKNQDPVNIPELKRQCDLMVATANQIKALNLTTGRGKSAKTVTFEPSAEMLNLCEVAPVTCATQRYTAGLDHEAAGQHKQAAIAYREAFTCLPGFEDSESRYATSRANAMVKVALLDGTNAAQLCRTIVNSATNASKEEGGSLEFVNIVAPGILRSSASSEPSSPKEIARAAAKIGGVSKVLFITGVNYSDDHRPVEMEIIANDSCQIVVYSTSRSVATSVSYQLIDVATATVKRSDSVAIESIDERKWSRVGINTESSSASDGIGGLIGGLVGDLMVYGICQAEAKRNANVGPYLKNPEAEPVSQSEIRERAEVASGQRIFADIMNDL